MFTETVECVNGGLARLLEAVRAGDLPVAQLKDLIAASRSWEAKVAALQADTARTISAREGHGDGGASVLRDQAGKSRVQARRSLSAAEVLDEMPSLRSSVDSGEVPLANAERLADAARRIAPDAVDSASDLLAMAKELPPDRFAREANVWAQRHQSDHGHGDWINKRRRRYLKTWKQQDGMVRLDGLLDPETGTRICNRLQDTAEELRRQDQQSARTPARDDPAPDRALGPSEGSDDGESVRSWDQLRADALELLTSGAADGAGERGGSGGRPRAEVIVVADIGALTGDDPAGRCEIPGTGPVPRTVLERIACDAQLTGLIFQRRQTAAPRSFSAHRHHRPMADAHRQRPRLHRLRRRTRPMPSPPHHPLRPTTANRHQKPRPRLLALPPQHPRPPLASRPQQRQTRPPTPRPPGPARPRRRPPPPRPNSPRPRTPRLPTATTGPQLSAGPRPATSQSPGQTGPDLPRISPPGRQPRPATANSPRPLPGLTTTEMRHPKPGPGRGVARGQGFAAPRRNRARDRTRRPDEATAKGASAARPDGSAGPMPSSAITGWCPLGRIALHGNTELA